MNLRRLSTRERAGNEDLLKMMQAMADPKKTATMYSPWQKRGVFTKGGSFQTRNSPRRKPSVSGWDRKA
jgi:hypothetical protein